MRGGGRVGVAASSGVDDPTQEVSGVRRWGGQRGWWSSLYIGGKGSAIMILVNDQSQMEGGVGGNHSLCLSQWGRVGLDRQPWVGVARTSDGTPWQTDQKVPFPWVCQGLTWGSVEGVHDGRGSHWTGIGRVLPRGVVGKSKLTG
eukprot:749046-Hanusia_phi.AAC.2